MIQLREMNEAEFSEAKPIFIEEYAQDISRNFGIPIEEARAGSSGQIDEQLKQGLSTPDQLLYIVQLIKGNEAVNIGYLWLDVNDTKRRGYINYIYLHEEFRGHGLGKQTLELLEARMKERNIQRIGLNVFADNEVARNLYNRLGYQVTNLNMQKWLAI